MYVGYKNIFSTPKGILISDIHCIRHSNDRKNGDRDLDLSFSSTNALNIRLYQILLHHLNILEPRHMYHSYNM